MAFAETVYALCAEHSSCNIADEAVVLDMVKGVYYGLNPVAARIWNLLLQQPRTLDEIVHILQSEFDVDLGQCRIDVSEFLNRLADAGLLRQPA